MTTGIPLFQPVPVRAAAQSRAAQLSPLGAGIDAPEQRDFSAALREAKGKSELDTPSQHAGLVDRPGAPDEKKKPHKTDKDDSEQGGGSSGDVGDALSQTPPEATSKESDTGGEGVSNEPPVGEAEAKKQAAADAAQANEDDAEGQTRLVQTKGTGGEARPTDGESSAGDNGVDLDVKDESATPTLADVETSEAAGGAPDTNEVEASAAAIGATPNGDEAGGVGGVTPGAGEGVSSRGPSTPAEQAPPTNHEAKLRFDESVRAEVRRPAHVDLDELAAEELTKPTRSHWGGQRASGGAARLETNSVTGEERSPSTRVEGENASRESKATTAGARSPVVAPAPTPPSRAERVETSSAPRVEGDVVSQAQSSRADAGGRGGEQKGGQAGADSAGVGVQSAGRAGAGGVQVSTFHAELQNAAGIKGGESERAIGRTPGAETAKNASKPPPITRPDTGEAARRVMAQVSRGVASILRQKGGSLTLRLSPQSLGELKISMRLENGGVRASFKPSESSARELLQNNLDSLKTALEQHGVRVERLSVEGGSESPRDAATHRAEDPRFQGEDSPSWNDPTESGADGRSPGDQGHGGRSDGDAGGGPWANHGSRGGAGRASDDAGVGVIAGGMTRQGVFLGLDTLA
ncbi:MAG: flagellar hook-length control protein FliK [Phycisphaerales bacterium]